MIIIILSRNSIVITNLREERCNVRCNDNIELEKHEKCEQQLQTIKILRPTEKRVLKLK